MFQQDSESSLLTGTLGLLCFQLQPLFVQLLVCLFIYSQSWGHQRKMLYQLGGGKLYRKFIFDNLWQTLSLKTLQIQLRTRIARISVTVKRAVCHCSLSLRTIRKHMDE